MDLEELEVEIGEVLAKLERIDPTDGEYETVLRSYERLVRIRNEMCKAYYDFSMSEKQMELEDLKLESAQLDNEKKKKPERVRDKIDWTKVLVLGVSTAQLIMIMNFEKADVIATKAFNLFIKPKA